MRTSITAILVLMTGSLLFADEDKNETKEERARTDLAILTNACKSFKLRHDEWPEKLEDLLKPPSKRRPYLEDDKLLTDPWGNKYKYDSKGKHHNGARPDIWTIGPDKKEIGNWPEKPVK